MAEQFFFFFLDNNSALLKSEFPFNRDEIALDLFSFHQNFLVQFQTLLCLVIMRRIKPQLIEFNLIPK